MRHDKEARALKSSEAVHQSLHFDKRRYTSILIISVYSTQMVLASILHHLDLFSGQASWLQIAFHVLTLLAAIPQAGFSDDSGRKKHLLISQYVVLFSIALFSSILLLSGSPADSQSSILKVSPWLIVCVLGLAGNTIPIARGCLTALKIHNFRSAIGYSTVAIGLGWITVDLLDIVFEPLQIFFIAICIQITSTFFVARYYKFLDPNEEHTGEGGLRIIFKSYGWLLHMLVVVGGSALVLTYFFTETAFYHVYDLNEGAAASLVKKASGALMGIAYSIGVVFQSIINPTDKGSVKYGLIISFVSLVAIFFFNQPGFENRLLQIGAILSVPILAIVEFVFAFGFGFFIPALFSIMAKKIHEDHYGRLFGVVDVTDTLSLILSGALWLFGSKGDFNKVLVQVFLLIIFFTSVIMSFKLRKAFKTYEENE